VPAVEGEVLWADAGEVVAGLGPWLAVASPSGWAASGLEASAPPPQRHLAPTSLEELDLDGLADQLEESHEPATLVGVGGGLALDSAKYLAWRRDWPLVLVPTALGSLAPFTAEVARRVRRQQVWTGHAAARRVLDPRVLAAAPPALNRAGAAEVVATASATWDWRLADARDKGMPFSAAVADVGSRCRSDLAEAAPAIAAAGLEGLQVLARLLADLAEACARVGHRRLVDGSEHTFVQAYEHRLGRLPSYGGLLGLGSVAMATLQQWYGVSAGGPVDPHEIVDLLTRCAVAANPHQLELDEGTFRGLLRHAVRFHVGEFLPWGVLDEADVNWSAAEEMWRMCWRVPIVR
jgi:glycerol dehydrogenase-like iron-containing ADH family enzyme